MLRGSWLIDWAINIELEPLRADAPRPYRRALCATKSNINSGQACSFTKVTDGPQN